MTARATGRTIARALGRSIGQTAVAVVALLCVLLGLFLALNFRYVVAFPAILPGFYAKEFCSCRYVMNRPVDACHAYARQWLPIGGFELDEATRTVRVRALGVSREARHVDPRFGCLLDPD